MSFGQGNINNDVQVLFIFALGILGVLTGLYGFRVVLNSSVINGIVRHFLLCITLSATTINACHLCWGMPRALWSESVNIPLIDNIFGFIAFGLISVILISKILLGINRFTAIIFEGKFYEIMEKHKNFQYSILIGYSILMSAPMVFPGFRVIWVTDGVNAFFLENSPHSDLYLNISQPFAGYATIMICLFLDTITFILIYRRMKIFKLKSLHQQRANLKKQYFLLTQMMFSNGAVVVSTVGILVILTFTANDMATFICYTAMWQASCVMEGLFCIVFLRDRSHSSRVLKIRGAPTITTG
ncbi:unnamed protein product, partial [Mesorhabditis belari]|uniref:7TM GPCR serpentine receptor class x (Srx) domain-containing protein n=1 Tax=Mesorhabditis belari TaxID=2138241 RepID=A0AAF3FKQ3_9BILA